ncbi:hypothetical protein [Cupriavidus sp. UYPR2.512]|uniref:hypothetical protein n=1 Tax=Cupriavidus sp. UYPR2.512 TaxID=1080187 RepID=UPI0012FCF586|nr:hypothetical protein [Cupriavidus sp. UYPR2.512]UIF88185.1 hypothetical protein KAF44_20240 [Cupriavidus necator]
MLEQRVVLAVEVRRFKCANADCPRHTFAENIRQVSGRWHLLCNLRANVERYCTDSGRNCPKPRSKPRSVA